MPTPDSRCSLLASASLLLIACGPSDGIIGTLGAAPPLAATPTFEEQFVNAGANWDTEMRLPESYVNVGDEDTAAVDDRVATIILPGHADYEASDGSGPDVASALASTRRFGFGTFRSRIAFGACSADEEAAQAMLGYFSDGADHDGNGITDEIEIDVQVLCGSPSRAYLTVFTDYEEHAGTLAFRKLGHIVDFSTGRTYDTPSDSSDDFVPGSVDPALVLPGIFEAGRFYELGFEWHESSIRFFLDTGTGEKTLWTLDDAAHVPSEPVVIIYNAWHPDTHWFPASDAADFPATDVVMRVDWLRYWAE